MTSTEPLGPMVRIKEIRVLRGLSQAQLADRIAEQGVRITDAGISNVENGNKKASDRLLLAWAVALGLNPLNTWQGPLRKPIKAGVPDRAA